MSLYRVGKVYYLDILTQSGRVRRSTGTTDKQAAEAYHQRVKDQIWRKEKLGEKPPITWSEAVKRWLAEKERGTPDRYRIRSFGVDENSTLPLSEQSITTALKSARSSGTWNRGLTLIVAIHNTSGVTPPSSVKRKANPIGRTRYLEKDKEWPRLKAALLKHSELLHDAAEFTLVTGLRENNVLNLQWVDVDLRRRQAVIYADEFKTNIALGVPLTDDAMAVLERRKGLDKQYVFAGEYTGLPLYKASNRAWYAALREAKLVGFRWHDLRHTWASWHVMGGTRLEELMDLGGWKTFQMVKRYAHLSVDHLAKVAENVRL